MLRLSRTVLFIAAILLEFVNPARSQTRTEVGTVAGSFDVTLSGSASYSIPIRIAPGTAGTEPRIALTYDSQSPGGSLGAGWSVSGLSVITRGPKNILTDGVLDAVRLEETDALFLDGQRLIPIGQTGSGSARRIEYRKETDDQSRILQTGADFASSTFSVETKGGLRMLFDGANYSRVGLRDGSVLLVAASRISDTAGNYIEFRYRTNGEGDHDVESIRYTGHEERDPLGNVRNSRRPYASIEFAYDAVPRPFETYVAGRLIRRASRLRSITSRVSPEPDDAPSPTWATVARYELEYEERDTANRFVLVRVHQFGEDGSELTPTKFGYSPADVGWRPATYELPIAALAGKEQLGAAYRFAHFAPGTAKALPDLLFAAQVGGSLEAFAFRNDGGSWTRVDGFRPPFPFASADGTDLGAVLVDLDGDGRIDLIQSYRSPDGKQESRAFLAGTDGWQSADGYRLPFTVSDGGRAAARYFFARLTNPNRPDLVYDDGNTRGFLINTGSGWQADPSHTPPERLEAGSRLLDFDCNGTPGLIARVRTGDTYTWKVYRYTSDRWEPVTDTGFLPPYSARLHPEAVLDIKFDRNGCQGVVVAVAGGERGAFVASPSGWKPVEGKTPPFDLVDGAGHSAGAVVADFDGDGRPGVMAHRLVPGAAPIRFAYRQTVVGWEPLPEAFIPPALGDLAPQAAPVNAFVGDIDGDGRPDVVVPSGGRASFGRVYRGTPAGFAEQPSYAPPVAFGRRDQQDWGVRFVDLNGDGLPDIIYRRDVVKDGHVTRIEGAFINRGGWWEPAPGLVPPLPLAGDDITGNPVQFVDVDGDGFVDMLYSYRRADGSVTRAYFHNEPAVPGQREPRRWVEQTGSALIPLAEFPFAAQGVGDLGVRFVDLNGDGRPDMLVGTLPAAMGQPVETCRTVNGTAVCELNRSAFEVAAFLNDGRAWTPAPTFNPPLPFVARAGSAVEASRDLWVQLVDVDGDGLPDIVAAFRHPWDQSRVVREVWFNTGSGWRLSPDQLLPDLQPGVPLLLDEPSRDPRALFQWVDVNGDGLPDLVLSRREGDTNGSTTWLSTGRGFVEAPNWRLPLDALADRGGDPAFRLIDVNGDGFVDVLYSRRVSADRVERGLYVNNGSTWVAADARTFDTLPPFVDETGADQGVRLIDVDGNGLVDVVQSFASGPSGDVSEAKVLLNAGRRADVLQSLDPGYELRTSISYQTLLEPTADAGGPRVAAAAPWPRVYEPGTPGSYPLISPVPATYVVRRAVVDEGGGRAVGFSYRYGEFRIDARSRRPLGFRWRESLNEASGVLTRTEMVQDARIRALPRRDATCWLKPADRPVGEPLPENLCPPGEARWAGWAQKLSETENDWEVVEGFVGGGPIPRRTVRQVHMAAATSRAYELDGLPVSWQRDTFEYDAPANILSRRLNALRTRTQRGDGTSVETTNEYAQDDEERWFFGRLTRSVVKRVGDVVAPGSAERRTETRAAAFSYDGTTGLLVEGIADHGHEKAVTSRYGRDRFGNVVATTVSAPGEAPRTSRTEYDALGRFAVAETNPLGHRTTRAPRLTTGAPERIADPNGLETRYEYDGFGRPRREVAPGGVVRLTAMLPADRIEDVEALRGLRVAYAVRTQVEGLPASLGLYDSKGRLVRSVTDGFTRDGTTARPIERDTVYDLLGRRVRASVPAERGSQQLWTSATYDVMDRTVETRAANGATTRTQFRSHPGGGRAVAVVDPLGRTSVAESNMRGLMIASVDPTGARTRHLYDAADRVLLSVGPTGAETRHTYDAIGRRVETRDPDLGRWHYGYDPFGRVVRQTDANGQITTLEYDALGRPSRKVQNDGTWTWVYDQARNGVGRVAVTTGSDGYREEFHYDALGRVDRWAVTIGQEQFVTTTDYDRLGRVSAVHYPSSFAVENVYDAKGFQTAIRDLRTKETYWTAEDIDALGRVVSERYGNGLQGKRGFDTKTGRPTHVQVTAGRGPEVLDLRLQYDLVGNLLRREEGVERVQEAFSYDRLDRLVGVRHRDGRQDRYAFDAAGRMTFKSGVGAYTYVQPAGRTLQDDPQLGPPVNIPAMEDGAEALGRGHGRTENVAEHTPGRDTRSGPFHGVLTTRNGAETRLYDYDPAGNMTRANDTRLEYTADNRLRLIFGDQWRWTTFDYGTNGQRYRRFSRTGLDVAETLYVGAYERVSEYAGPILDARHGRLIRHRHYLTAPTGTFATVELNTEYAEFVATPAAPAPAWTRAPGDTGASPGSSSVVGRPSRPSTPGNPFQLRRGASDTKKIWYLHKDQLGSTLRITDEEGRRAAAFWYDPWGARISRVNDSPREARLGRRLAASWDRGFTGHEHIDQASLVHMNGRVYSARLGAFTSADVVNQSLADTQAANGYAYARGNPLRYTDPSGYSWLGDAWNAVTSPFRAAASGFEHLLNESGKWLKENWRQVVIVAAVITVTVLTAGTGTVAAASLGSAILSGMAAGATGGALGAALYGGSFEDVVAGAIKGAVIGAFSGAAAHGVGVLFGGTSALSGAGRVFGRGVVGGAAETIRGGDFWRGAGASAVSAAAADFGPDFGTPGLEAVKAALVGGATSAIGGDKFANGAILAVFSTVYRGSLTNSIAAEGGASPRAVAKALFDVAGKLWNLPNTYLGLAYGYLGYVTGYVGYEMGLLNTAPEILVGNNSVQFYHNPFATLGAITLGNATVFGGLLTDLGRDNNPMWRHEMQHTYQGQVLGPLYFPSNILGGVSGWVGGGDWHSKWNWNEQGPQQDPPSPWR